MVLLRLPRRPISSAVALNMTSSCGPTTRLTALPEGLGDCKALATLNPTSCPGPTAPPELVPNGSATRGAHDTQPELHQVPVLNQIFFWNCETATQIKCPTPKQRICLPCGPDTLNLPSWRFRSNRDWPLSPYRLRLRAVVAPAPVTCISPRRAWPSRAPIGRRASVNATELSHTPPIRGLWVSCPVV